MPNFYADGNAANQNAKNWWDQMWGGWNGMWGDIAAADKKRTEDNMANYHQRPDYQRNLAQLNQSRNMPANTPNTSQSALNAPSGAGRGYIPGPRNPEPFPNGLPVSEPQLTEDERMMQDTINAIKQRLQMQYVDDGSYNNMIDEAYSGALGAIGNARTKANSNYTASDKALETLTAGHVNSIKTEDLAAIKDIGAANQKAVGGIYDNTTQELQADRSRDIQERAEALARYGLADSGMGAVGEQQNQALANTAEKKTGALNQAQGMQAADEALNVERGQAQAAAGVERRSSLRRDLDTILGNLDNSEATVQNSKAQARLAAQQADKADFLNTQKADADTLDMILSNKREDAKFNAEMAAKNSKANGTATAFDVAANRLGARGVDVNTLKGVYSDVLADNSYSSVSGQSEAAHFVSEMRKKLQKQKKDVSNADLMEYVTLIQNYGTDKGTAIG